MTYTTSYASNGTTQPASHASHNQLPYMGAGISPQALIKQSASEIASLAPGIHLLPTIDSTPFRDMSPQEILRKFKTVPPHQPATTDAVATKRVQYLERRPEHQGKPVAESPSITFAVHGVPGPYVSSLMAGDLPLDGSSDHIFDNPWSGLVRVAHHPYLSTLRPASTIPRLTPPTRINSRIGPEKRHITRAEFATELAFRIYKSVSNGDRLRLVSIDFYGKHWVPVLAIDVE
ncbi:hypothetical protein AAF712_014870 [Marasmius tenuissimus]|uniref:Uncharacterized protein n=1 Tax=Marasmius tenuissimus TaxID=585030 RepID=A0ABR2ZBY2_9AGAR